MKKAEYNILPVTEEILQTMGEQIKLARLRRSLSAELVAERAGISRASLWKVEKGAPSVAMGIYAAVLHALNNLDKDLLLVAKDDEMGRQLQDLNLITRKRAPRRSKCGRLCGRYLENHQRQLGKNSCWIWLDSQTDRRNETCLLVPTAMGFLLPICQTTRR